MVVATMESYTFIFVVPHATMSLMFVLVSTRNPIAHVLLPRILLTFQLPFCIIFTLLSPSFAFPSGFPLSQPARSFRPTSPCTFPRSLACLSSMCCSHARSVEVRQRPSTGSAIARVVVRGHSKTATTLDGRRIGRQCRSHVH